MARIRKVTRTLKSTEATVLTVNQSTNEVADVTVTIAGEVSDTDTALKYIKKRTTFAQDVIPVAVKALKPVEAHYSMLEEDFIKYATIDNDAEAED